MVRRVSDMQLELAQAKGAKVSRPPLDVHFPELIALFEHFHKMKHEHSLKHEAQWEKKFEKLDQLIKAIENIKLGGSGDSAAVAKILLQIKKEHSTVTAEHKALKEVAHVHENCAYKLTGKRDQRGLIDIEAGLVFTPINGD